jgi:hypothetical protein
MNYHHTQFQCPPLTGIDVAPILDVCLHDCHIGFNEAVVFKARTKFYQ